MNYGNGKIWLLFVSTVEGSLRWMLYLKADLISQDSKACTMLSRAEQPELVREMLAALCNMWVKEQLAVCWEQIPQENLVK